MKKIIQINDEGERVTIRNVRGAVVEMPDGSLLVCLAANEGGQIFAPLANSPTSQARVLCERLFESSQNGRKNLTKYEARLREIIERSAPCGLFARVLRFFDLARFFE